MAVQETSSKKTILCYGDSNTWGAVPGLFRERYPIHVRWPGALFKLLRTAGYRVVEEGLCGRTTVFDDPIEGAFGVQKNGMKVLGAVLASHCPLDLVIIMLGTNDLKRRFSVNAADIAAGVGALVQVARSPQFGPGLSTPPDVLVICPPAIWEVEAGFGAIFKGGREKSQYLTTAFNNMGKTLSVPVLFAEDFAHSDPSDGIHFSAETHGIIAQEVCRWILERDGNN